MSGIYLYYAPRRDEWVWITDLGVGSGVEIAQFHHRFATVEPSVHNSTGRIYRWWYGDREAGKPRPTDLPWLPPEWGKYLLSPREYVVKGAAQEAEVVAWYGKVSGGAMCYYMKNASEIEAGKIRAAAVLGGLHDTIVATAMFLCTNAAEGHKGLDYALGVCEDAFMNSGRRRNLRSEWKGAVNSAMAKAAALPQAKGDECSKFVSPWRRTS